MLGGANEVIACWILLGSFLVLLLIRVPISFTLAISSLATIIYLRLPFQVVAQKMSDGMDTFALMAIPFFVLAGEIMARGGMARKLVDFARLLVGWLPGGLAVVNVLSSMFFGGISGSSVADTSAIGSILIPAMQERGYHRDYATNLTITASTQGIIIPPSHNAIIYSLVAGGSASIAQLFVAGIIPGIMVGLSLMAVALVIAVRRGYPREPVKSFREAGKITWDALLALGSPVIIVGGVVFGWFTATESSAIAVLWALVVTFIFYREISFRRYYQIALDGMRVIAMVLFLIASASAFGYLLAYLQIPARITKALLGITSNKYLLLLIINLILLGLGMIMDMAPLIIITTPILLPVVRSVGVDPVHFGIIMLLNLGIGLCTPPVGSTLFVGCAISGAKIEELVRGIFPFYLAMVVVLLFVTYLPFLSMGLVRILLP